MVLRSRFPSIWKAASGGGGFTLVAEAGVFTLAGQNVDLRLARRLEAEPGVFSLSGQDAALLFARRLEAAAGVFALSGQDAALLLARRLEVEPGVFTLAGQQVFFIYTATPSEARNQIILRRRRRWSR